MVVMTSKRQHPPQRREGAKGTQRNSSAFLCGGSLRLCVFAAKLLTLTYTTTALARTATNYPTRPLRMLVPFGPGGNSDFAARIISPKLAQELGAQIVIDNRAGAGGNVGVQVAARANADRSEERRVGKECA